MSRNLSVTEPHPSVPKTGGYIYGGRGGAGNYKRYKADDVTQGATATGPASRISLSKASKRQPMQYLGRGGAGNVFKAETEERVFQFDEEMVKKREIQAPVYHIGRGGAGNWADANRQPRTERLDSSASAVSSNSDDSSSEGAARKTEGAFSKLARRFS